MTKMALSSCIGWLDLGEEDQRRAREYLAQFNGDNTLDELGFGSVRDAFADLLADRWRKAKWWKGAY